MLNKPKHGRDAEGYNFGGSAFYLIAAKANATEKDMGKIGGPLPTTDSGAQAPSNLKKTY